MTSLCTKALYHNEDTRMNMYEFDNLAPEQRAGRYPDLDKIKETAEAVACLMTDYSIIETQNNYTLRDKTLTLTETVFHTPISRANPKIKFEADLAEHEKFRTELAPGFGSGFLILKGKKNNIFLTAGHCVCTDDSLKTKDALSKIRIVFRYHKTQADADKRVFDKKDVYKIKRVISYSYNSQDTTVRDWALIKLDRVAAGIKPIQVDFTATLERSVYALGCPSGTAVKAAGIGYSMVKKVESDFVYCDVDTFAGNSGCPIIDRATNKAIAILIRGNRDYEIDEEYRKATGKKRVITSRTNPAVSGYEKGQRIAPDIVDFHKLVAMKGRKKREWLSNQKSEKFVNDLEAKKKEWKFNRNFCGALMFTGIGIPGGLLGAILNHCDVKTVDKDFALYKQMIGLYYRVHNIKINSLEVVHLKEIAVSRCKNFEQLEESVEYLSKHVRGYEGCAVDTVTACDDLELVRNMVAYDIAMDDARTLRKFEVEVFKDRFSPDKILDLLLYQSTKDVNLTVQARKRILKQMQKRDPENESVHLGVEARAQAVVEARIRACVKSTKNEQAYKKYPKEDIEKISRHYVEQSPRLDFEAARLELSLPEPT